MKTKDSITGVEQMFRAFADRNRLRILHLLFGGKLCVRAIVQILDVLPEGLPASGLSAEGRADQGP